MIHSIRRIPLPEFRAAALSILIGVALMAIKFIAYFLTGSAAIFSDAVESIVNVSASCVAFYSLMLAHSPADAEHPYGHGKVEFMSAGFEGGMILLAAIFILIRTIEALIHQQLQVEELGVGLLLMALAMVVNGVVGLVLIRTGRKHQSITLEADGYHLISDAVTSIVALLALALVKFLNWTYADPIAALLIAVYIAYLGTNLLRRSAAGLMDRQDIADEKLLRQILDSHTGPAGVEPRICSYHKLRHRHSGRYHWVDFHIMVPPGMSVDQGHSIASAIEYEIERAIGEGNATAHVEPCHDQPCETYPRK